MAKRIIVKVQLPIVSNDPDVGVLVYNKSRSVMQELPLRSKKEMKQLVKLIGDEMKGYFYAEVEGTGLILKGEAPWQSW